MAREARARRRLHPARCADGEDHPGLLLLGAYLIKGFARYGQSYLMASVGERVVATLRHTLYAHVQRMPLSFFAGLHSAELLSRIVTDVNRLARGSRRRSW